MALTPVHIFTLAYPDGTVRRKAVPGGYCDITRCRDHVEAKHPDAEIVHETWRSDYRFITDNADSQPDYGAAPNQLDVMRWRRDLDHVIARFEPAHHDKAA